MHGRTESHARRFMVPPDRAWLAASACIVLWLAGGVTDAAAQGAQATLAGVVTDAQGGAIPGVTVTAESPALASPTTAVTDAAGQYSLTVPAGAYAITFGANGFDPERRAGVMLTAGVTRNLDVTLQVAALAEQVDVVGVTPLAGVGLERDRVAGSVSVVETDEVLARGAASFADMLHERLGSVTLEGTTTNLFQPTLRFRGFTASPLLGLPQGIAVYQNGVRINEPFGDTVQFDLMPQFAIDQVELSAGANPTFGLNALGGALSLRLKNGFDNPGFRGEFSGGSFGRTTTTAEYGANNGRWAFYGGATRFEETGWRVASPSDVTQLFADIGYRGERANGGINVTYADTSLTGNAAAPVELLDVDRNAVFTYPDVTDNRLGFVQARTNLTFSPVWSVQVTGYYRDLDRRTLNGDEAEFEACDDDLLPPGAPAGTLCFGEDDDDDDDNGHDDDGHDDDDDHDHGDDDGDDDGHDDDDDHDDDHDHDDDDHDDDHDVDDEFFAIPLIDQATSRFITALDVAGDGAINRTFTRTRGYGTSFQATARTTVGGTDNVFVAGLSADLADTDFSTSSETGSLTPDRGVTGSGLFASLHGLGGDDIFNTGLESTNNLVGLYVSNTLSPTDRVHLTVSGRYNRAQIDIVDLLGSSLDGSHTFDRFNPAAGVVIDTGDGTSLFARYSESSRAPTAAELSCADPAEPCRVPNAFVADPPLDQIVARSFEAGVRGRWGSGEWSLTSYRTLIDDDILFIASPELIGTGYFQNAGNTARLGFDIELSGRVERTSWYASVGVVDATFESPLLLPGDEEVNDAADDDGLPVEPGDRLPGIPRYSLKAGIRQAVTDDWDVALETVTASSRYFAGDEGNDQVTLDGYGIVTFLSAYRIGAGVELFGRVDNLFGALYSTAGILAELEVHLREVPNASDPRFVAPGPPRSAFGGIRVRF
ncbi:MAG: TonB-dependent receptor [Acidobacteria bacterium]|nr:TonB-dependent receptor [Acidobacteriota bacterium]